MPSHVAVRSAWLFAPLLFWPFCVAAQEFPGFGGVEARGGVVLPEGPRTGLSAAVDADLGYVGAPVLRTVVGFTYFGADVRDRPFGGGQRASGSIASTGGRVGLRFDLLGAADLGPFVSVFLAGQRVTVDADTPEERDLLDREFGGFLVGASLGGGLSFALDDGARFRAVAEVRRVFMANVPHWAAEAGIRIVPFGRAAYTPPPRWDRGWNPSDRESAAAAERARQERERLEAERIQAEQGRAAAADRRLQDTEEERRAAELEAERAGQRARAAEAEARREAEQRTAAELEAERLRAETAAAERRARDAEARLYDALLDLDRLITNVTGIRETERGLAIILGQGLFAVGQHALSPRARDEVGRIAAVLLQYPDHRISVEGHTDSTGSEATNQRLSELRARSVQAALVAEGVDPRRVEIAGFGQGWPIADNATPAGRAENRRVEIVLLGARRPGATP
jgi:outer membrane protein OmpA-like peptidoglycan-associated protein